MICGCVRPPVAGCKFQFRGATFHRILARMQSKGTQIDAVIFDIGGVLIDFDFELAFRAAATVVGLSTAEIRDRLFGAADYANLDRHRDIVTYECGKMSCRDFHASVERSLKCSLPYDAFCATWNSIFIGEIEPTVRLMRALMNDSKLKVGVLSNTNKLHFEYIRPRMGFLDEIEHVYASHEIGVRKPDAKSFLHVLREMDVMPERSVFVDDLPENIVGAQKVGMKTVHATDPQAVRDGLRAFGIAVE
jgi:glucose-1-phosphatase